MVPAVFVSVDQTMHCTVQSEDFESGLQTFYQTAADLFGWRQRTIDQSDEERNDGSILQARF